MTHEEILIKIQELKQELSDYKSISNRQLSSFNSILQGITISLGTEITQLINDKLTAINLLNELNTIKSKLSELEQGQDYFKDYTGKTSIQLYTQTNVIINPLTGAKVIPQAPLITGNQIINENYPFVATDGSKWYFYDSQIPESEKAQYTWQLNGVYDQNNLSQYVKWNTPIRLTPEDGTDGEDGKYREYIYKVTETEIHPELPPSSPYSEDDPRFQLSDNWVKDAVNAIPTITNRFTWTAWREKDKLTEQWGNYQGPSLWSVFSKNGKDGDGVEWIFHLVTNEEYQEYLDYIAGKDKEFENISWVANLNAKSDTKDWQTNSEVVKLIGYNWTDDGQDPNSDTPYVFATYRRKTADENGIGIWGQFKFPFYWARWAEDGKDSPLIEYIHIGITKSEYDNWENSFQLELSSAINQAYTHLSTEVKQQDEVAQALNDLNITINDRRITIEDDSPGLKDYFAIARSHRKKIDGQWPNIDPFNRFTLCEVKGIDGQKGDKGDSGDSVLLINLQPNNIFRTYDVEHGEYPLEGNTIEIKAYGQKGNDLYGIFKPDFNGNLRIEKDSLIYVSSNYTESGITKTINDGLTLSTSIIRLEDKIPLNLILSTRFSEETDDSWIYYNEGKSSDITLNFYKAVNTIYSTDYNLESFLESHQNDLVHMPYLLQIMKYNNKEAVGEIANPPGVICSNDSININVDNSYYTTSKQYTFSLIFYVGNKQLYDVNIIDITHPLIKNKASVTQYNNKYVVSFEINSDVKFTEPVIITINASNSNYSWIKDIQLRPSINDTYEIVPNIQYITCTGGTGQISTRTNWQPIKQMSSGNYIFFPCNVFKNGIKLLNTNTELYNLYWRVYFKDTKNKTWYLNGNKLSENDCKYKMSQSAGPAIYIPTTDLDMNTGVTIEIYRNVGTDYTLLDLEKVDLIIEGSMGVPGSTIRMRGEYKPESWYFNNIIPSSVREAQDLCPYQVIDVVLFENNYYRLNDTTQSYQADQSFKFDVWEQFTNYDNIATGVIIAENSYAKIAQNGTLIVGDDIPNNLMPEDLEKNNIIITNSNNGSAIKSQTVVKKKLGEFGIDTYILQENWNLSGKDGLTIKALSKTPDIIYSNSPQIRIHDGLIDVTSNNDCLRLGFTSDNKPTLSYYENKIFQWDLADINKTINRTRSEFMPVYADSYQIIPSGNNVFLTLATDIVDNRNYAEYLYNEDSIVVTHLQNHGISSESISNEIKTSINQYEFEAVERLYNTYTNELRLYPGSTQYSGAVDFYMNYVIDNDTVYPFITFNKEEISGWQKGTCEQKITDLMHHTQCFLIPYKTAHFIISTLNGWKTQLSQYNFDCRFISNLARNIVKRQSATINDLNNAILNVIDDSQIKEITGVYVNNGYYNFEQYDLLGLSCQNGRR